MFLGAYVVEVGHACLENIFSYLDVQFCSDNELVSACEIDRYSSKAIFIE